MSVPEASTDITVERSIRLRSAAGGRREIAAAENEPAVIFEEGRVPRISRLLALAHRMQGLVDAGEVRDYSDLSRLGGVTTARMTQIMSLLLLAPDIQEEILFLPRVVVGVDPIHERSVGRLVRSLDWSAQRREWAKVRGGGASR